MALRRAAPTPPAPKRTNGISRGSVAQLLICVADTRSAREAIVNERLALAASMRRAPPPNDLLL
jgi:hypothetical protein